MSTPLRRVAVVHDFLYCYAGAERVLEQILRVFPDADLFSLFDFLEDDQRGFIQEKEAQASFIQRLPWARRNHRIYLPLMPLAVEQLDVTRYELVISSSYVAAKGVLTNADQLHVCYCHTPARFAWDLQQQYLKESGLSSACGDGHGGVGRGLGLLRGAKSLLARSVLHYIRNWDVHSAQGVDAFVTNSDYVGRRIRKVYRRAATTIYPPVDVDYFTPREDKQDFYLTTSRLVPYKRIDLIVAAFNEMPKRRLIVIGDGPDFERLRDEAAPNVTFMGQQPAEVLRDYLRRAKAFVFAAEEDFGIVLVEAQACGTPVIAYARGGACESVVDGVTGIFFPEQTLESLSEAIEAFEAHGRWDAAAIRQNAERFSAARFRAQFRSLVESEWTAFRRRREGGLRLGVRPEHFGVNGVRHPLETADDASIKIESALIRR